MNITPIIASKVNCKNSSNQTPHFQARMLELPSGRCIDSANVLEVLPGKSAGTAILRVSTEKNKLCMGVMQAFKVVIRITLRIPETLKLEPDRTFPRLIADNVSYAKTTEHVKALDIMQQTYPI